MAAAFRTRGQPAAEAVVRSFMAAGPPHAILLVGPPSAGKTTLALDLAAALLCDAPVPADRPCSACRGCRLVASGNHPDLHRLAPEGAGGQVVIGQVRALASELALLPVEGGARVAVVEAAHRLNEDAQHALLKTLEEPPSGVTIVLCADDEERLLPTVRSRCARVRLGPVAVREIERLLDDLGLADPPAAARLARLAAGRPGLAVSYAHAPGAVIVRGEVARTLLDLLGAGRATRLKAIRDLLARSDEAASALAAASLAAAGPAPAIEPRVRTGRGRGGATRGTSVAFAQDPELASESEGPGPSAGRSSAADRRRAATWLIEAWQELTRDLAVLPLGDPRIVRDPALLEELEAVRSGLAPGAAAAFLARLARAAEQLDANASPELLLDVLILAWPHAAAAA